MCLIKTEKSENKQMQNVIKAFNKAKGLWKDRKDLPDLAKMRKEAERFNIK